MPNYSLVANSTFQPFTYQELTAPLDRMEAYHEKLADEYDKLSSQADVLEALGKNDRDKGAYDRYKSYSDSLRQEADELYRHGLNAESRRRLSALRQRYNTDIVPIQNAWNKREEEAKAQQQALMQNPSIRFTRTASETPIDSYIDNPMGGYGVVNLDSITKDMSDAAKNLANQIRAGITFEGLDPYTTRYIEHYGLDPNIINDWVTNPSKMPILTQMMNDVLQKHGVTAEALAGSPNAASIVRESLGAAQRGAWSAIGADKSATFDNYAARQQAELDLYRAKKGVDAAGTAEDYDIFDRHQGQLPIAVADGKIDKSVKTDAEAFGWSPDKTTGAGYIPGSVQISYSTSAPKVTVDLFNANNRLKSWEEFYRDVNVSAKPNAAGVRPQGIQQHTLAKRAREAYQKALQTGVTLGLSAEGGYTRDELQRALSGKRASGGAGYINGYNWLHSNGDWNSTAQNMNVRKIDRVDHDGRFTFDSDTYTLGDILDTSADAKINKSKQDVHAFISDQDGQEGVIFTVGKQQFFMSKEAMMRADTQSGRAFDALRESSQAAAEADRIEQTNPEEAYTLRRIAKARANAALSLLERAFATQNSAEKQHVVDQPTSKENGLL